MTSEYTYTDRMVQTIRESITRSQIEDPVILQAIDPGQGGGDLDTVLERAYELCANEAERVQTAKKEAKALGVPYIYTPENPNNYLPDVNRVCFLIQYIEQYRETLDNPRVPLPRH